MVPFSMTSGDLWPGF